MFKKNGVDDIVCMSVNDAFVMDVWKQDQEAENITVIPVGNAEFTEAMGMLVDNTEPGFGKRSWRYSMLVRDGVIVKHFIEAETENDPIEVSDADIMIDYINPYAAKTDAVSIITRPGCPHCARAKAIMNRRGIAYEEILIGKQTTLRSVRAIAGRETIPQVFIGGRHVGGAEKLEKYFAEKSSEAA